MLDMDKKEFINGLKYAIFDMDGTVVDSLSFWDFCWSEIGKKYFANPDFRPDPEFDKAIRTITMKDTAILIKERYLPEETVDNIYNLCNDLIQYYYVNVVGTKTGVTEFLDKLLENGVKMCIASATEPRFIRIIMDKCGLGKYFSFVISCTDVGAGKDKPDVFLEALRRLGGDIGEACVFEDSCVALETAEKAGFKTVGIYDKNNYGQDRLKAASDIYLSENETYYDLI